MIRTDLWHGGAPGRGVDDFLQPPQVTGLERTSAVLSVEAGHGQIGYRDDRVYLTVDRDLARVWAGLWRRDDGRVGYGWLYRVSVEENALEPDEDLLSLPGLSFQVPSARVSAIYERAVAPNQPRFRRKLEQTLQTHTARRRPTQ